MTFPLAKLLKRDPRMVERKKTGRAKARKAVRCSYPSGFVPSHIRILCSTLGSSVDVLLRGPLEAICYSHIMSTPLIYAFLLSYH